MGWRTIFLNRAGLRSGWRILIYTLLFNLLIFLFAPLGTWMAASATGLVAMTWQWVPFLAAALVAGWIMMALVERRPIGALGFAATRAAPREFGVGILVGGLGLAIVAAGFALIGWLGYQPEGGTVGGIFAAVTGGFVFFLVAAAAEEALFRGYPFQVLVQGIGPVPATLLVSIAFAAAHLKNPNADAFALVNIFLAGIMLSAAYLRTRSLWFATAVHLGWNWSMATLLDLPVSGLTAFDTPFYEPVLKGPEWVTGGAFGPEGGLGGSIALVIVTLAVLFLPGLGVDPGLRKMRPLVDER